MKPPHHSTTTTTGSLKLLVALLLGHSVCFGQTQPTNATIQIGSPVYTCIERGPNSKIWESSLIYTNDEGTQATNNQYYTELATGICYLSNGQYVDSVEEVDPVPGGAQAVQGQHQVQWALNANTPNGAVTVITPDAKQLSSTVFGLAYYDAATGSNAAIGTLQNCTGSIVQPNQVLYTNAFSNLTADILYTYTKAGLSQDIVLRQAPLPPDAYGLVDGTSVLQIYTEFFNAPQPEMTVVTNNGIVDIPVLDFGEMKMAPGEAFLINDQGATTPAGNVSKQWVQMTNGTFLIESIPYSAISNQLQQLPQASNIKPQNSIRRLALSDWSRSRPTNEAKEHRPMHLAKVDTTGLRLKIDYDLLSSTNNLTLQGDTTYFVTGTVNVTGTTTIEGGTVVKYTNSSTASITATNLVCLTGPYRPGVFTSMNDNTVGTVISNSTGIPTNGAGTYLNFGTLPTTYSPLFYYLRFSYANQAITGTISSTIPNSITIWDCQFINCGTAFYTSFGGAVDGFPVYAYNSLFSGCTCAFSNIAGPYDIQVYAVNVTADKLQAFGVGSGCILSNSLLTAVTNRTGLVLDNCATNLNGTGIYTNVGAASYYLIPGSTNQGAGNAAYTPANLLADLQIKTTWPPVVEPVGFFTNNYMFSPQAGRDTNGTDRGYHYDAIDYAVSGIELSNATILILPGTVLAGYNATNNPNYGIQLYTNGIINCAGTATSSNCFVQYNTVQEQSTTNWSTSNWSALLVTPGAADSSSANFSFTDWCVLTSAGQITGQADVAFLMVLEDCQFYGGTFSSTAGPVLTMTNCLAQRVSMTVKDLALGNISPTFNNNLFLYGSLSVKHNESGIYTFRDNLFDQTSISLTAGSINVCSNNAYVTTNYGVLLPTNDIIVLTNGPAFQTGPLGPYYYPTNLSLIHAGSQPANDAGLYFYTVTTNEVIEGDNMVSIGFHYVGITNGEPMDTDGLPAVPNYLNDLSGNGVLNPFLIFDQSEYPNEPQVRLGYWRFNSPTWTNEAGVYPFSSNAIYASNSFSGNAVSLTSLNSHLLYPLTSGGQNLFDPANGTIRLWFQPNWSSTNSSAATNFYFFGTEDGSGHYFWNLTGFACTNTNGTNIGTALYFSTGSNDYARSWSFNSTAINLGSPLQFQSNVWCQIVLTYSPTNVTLYTNGQYVSSALVPPQSAITGYNIYTNGLGNLYYPSLSQVGDAFWIGGADSESGNQANGQFDEFETFNYPMTAQQVAAGYPYFGGNSTNMLDTYYVGRSDMLQTYVDGMFPPSYYNVVQCRLGYWRFDSPILYGEQGQMPISQSDVGLAPSWSGTALVVSNIADSHVTYQDVGSNGWANVNCHQGSVRFWFKPNTTAGPSQASPFFYMGTTNGGVIMDEWALWLNAGGTSIYFVTGSNGVGTNLTATCNLANTNQWTQIVLTYGSNGCSLYTNGSLLANGNAVTNWPRLSNRELGMVIGNNMSYNAPINGQFEEMETFNYRLAASDISNNFQTVASVDSDLDGIPDLLEDIKLSKNRPFLGAPVVITGTIEAEQFDMGGPGMAYSNTFTGTNYCYRPTGMTISSCNDLGGGYCLDQTQSNEWAKYTINVLVPQTYVIETRVAGIGTNGAFELQFATNGHTYVTNGPLVISSTNWSIVSSNIALAKGTNVMTLVMLTNGQTSGSFGANVGRFNYISIYPSMPVPAFGTTTIGMTLLTNSDYNSALQNATWIQGCINVLGAAGGTVELPHGTYFVAQPNPNESTDAYYNAAVYITNSNVRILGLGGPSDTTLIGYNRATTVFCLGEVFINGGKVQAQCSNFTLCNLTVEGQPHEAVTNTNGIAFVPGQFIPPALGVYPNLFPADTGALIVFEGSSAFNYNLLVSNCQFIGFDRAVVVTGGINVSNFMVNSCNFLPTGGVDTMGHLNTYSNQPTYNVEVAVYARSGGAYYNMIVVSNTYNGNSSIALTNTNTAAPVMLGDFLNLTDGVDWIAPDGLILLQQPGNAYIARNCITNHALEAIQLNAGPAAVVGNTFYTLANEPSCCALAEELGGNVGITGVGNMDNSVTFVGNGVYGERTGIRMGNNTVPTFVNCSGNWFNLSPVIPETTNESGAGSPAQVQVCSFSSVVGNKMVAGCHGIEFSSGSTNMLVMDNDFGSAVYAGIDYHYTGYSVANAQIYSNILGAGLTYHVQLPYTNSFSWFVGTNTFLDVNSNSVPAFLDPVSSAMHVFN